MDKEIVNDKPKVLLVDDEDALREAMARRLSRKGFFTETASDGDQALELFRQNPHDVVVLDIKMPGIDGIEVLRLIKKMDYEAQVIILSGHASLESAKQIVELGGFEYLLKPYELDDLAQKIMDAYQRKKGCCIS